jgi:stress-induced morphogen
MAQWPPRAVWHIQSMATTPETIRALLLAALPDAEVEVRDTTGGGDHFSARVVSSAFEGRGLVERHQLVYGALGDLMRADIHALSLSTQAPTERKQGLKQ